METKLPPELDTKQLYKALKDMEAKPNTMPYLQFKKFEPLFKSTTIKEVPTSIIDDLSKEYIGLIDPYKEVHVTNGSEVLFILPPIFLQFKSIDSKNALLIDINRNMANTNIPKYKEEAFYGMIKGLMEGQITEEHLAEINTSKARFAELMERFNANRTTSIVDTTEESEIYNTDVFDAYEE